MIAPKQNKEESRRFVGGVICTMCGKGNKDCKWYTPPQSTWERELLDTWFITSRERMSPAGAQLELIAFIKSLLQSQRDEIVGRIGDDIANRKEKTFVTDSDQEWARKVAKNRELDDILTHLHDRV